MEQLMIIWLPWNISFHFCNHSRMQPLNEFYYFAKVIEHGGYAAAARALRIPKSRLSRQVAALETRLGVRLLNRSTRRVVITEVGREVYAHAATMVEEAEAALQAVESARSEPSGTLRVSCPIAIAQSALAQMLPQFQLRYPRVRLLCEVSNRRVDVLSEGFDVALRVRTRPSGEDGLVMRSFGESRQLLVTSPQYLARSAHIERPEDLSAHDTLGFSLETGRHIWELSGPDRTRVRIEHTPRLVCQDFVVQRAAVLAGLGITLLPDSVAQADLAGGRLEQVLPAWSAPQGIVHAVFPSRRGMLPSVRAFIDFLAERLPGAVIA
jgi:DNA-binding transcriptional LysR family regulator